jgi:hypothetical protein
MPVILHQNRELLFCIFGTVAKKAHGFFLVSMGFADSYIKKNRGEFFFEPTNFFPFKMIVVIPCFNEPCIKYTLSSLFDCEYPGVETGVIVVVNSSENSSDEVFAQNRITIIELNALSIQLKSFNHLFVVEVKNLPAKQGGVGWARKIGMDWAVSMFNHFENDNGIIISLDADTLVEKNYLKSIYSYFINNPERVAATIYFEHKIHPYDYPTDELVKASVLYELYMRYYRNALSVTGFPNSIYTVGSCIAVKAGSYVAQGGMNRRKAGEDFYFLHKMAILGEISEINSTTVYPSSRPSDRVPFGTGAAIKKYCNGDNSLEYIYPLEAFIVLKSIFSSVENYYTKGDEIVPEDLSQNDSFIDFCNETKLHYEINELKQNCSSAEIFKKRFFNVFNAFKILKWMNYSLMHSFPKDSLLKESFKLLQIMGTEEKEIFFEPKTMLNLFRTLDKNRTIH